MSRPPEQLLLLLLNHPDLKVWEAGIGQWWKEDSVGLWRWVTERGYWSLAQMARPR
jgi:hypothetical protein